MNTTLNKSVGISISGLAILSLLLMFATVRAQSGNRNPTPPGPIRPPEEMRPASINERQFKMMEIEKEAARPRERSREEQQLAFLQIAEDYREIQMVNNKMMSAAMPSAEPNFLSIARTLEDIRKRAVRLKQNLRLAELSENKPAKDKYQPVHTASELKARLLLLDDSIMRLVRSPIFKTPEVVNVDESAKARGELEYIIVTSQLISKDADRLNKSAGKTP